MIIRIPAFATKIWWGGNPRFFDLPSVRKPFGGAKKLENDKKLKSDIRRCSTIGRQRVFIGGRAPRELPFAGSFIRDRP
jgi:hypothetical protein